MNPIMANTSNLKVDCSKWSLQYVNEPFRLHKLSNVFITDLNQLKKFEKELDCLSFTHNVTDIFSFSQTKDLYSKPRKPGTMLSDFLQFLKFFRKFLSNKFDISLDLKISASCSKYSLGDFLLCHDDKIEDRCIAFIYYLNSSWKENRGGSLDLFDHDENGQPSNVRYSFFPECNSLIFFEVGNLTHHQVSEVLTTKQSRKTINGWFHSKTVLHLKPLPKFEVASAFVETNCRDSLSYLKNVINDEFFEEKYIELIVESIESNDVIMLQNFLKSEVFDAMSQELNCPSISWIEQGPANRKKCDIAALETLPPKIGELISSFQSKSMCSFLESISGLKFFQTIAAGESVHLTTLEIQFWHSGGYSLMTYDDSNFKTATLDIWLFFNVLYPSTDDSNEHVSHVSGNIYYCEKEALTPKHEIEPSNNSICVVHKRKDETAFVPYISLNSEIRFHVIRLSYKL